MRVQHANNATQRADGPRARVAPPCRLAAARARADYRLAAPVSCDICGFDTAPISVSCPLTKGCRKVPEPDDMVLKSSVSQVPWRTREKRLPPLLLPLKREKKPEPDPLEPEPDGERGALDMTAEKAPERTPTTASVRAVATPNNAPTIVPISRYYWLLHSTT